VKSFRSARVNGFSVGESSDMIDRELNAGERVIVNTAHMSGSDIKALEAEGEKRGWGNRVLYSSSAPFSQIDL
jgi:hypothetical protein